MREATIMALLDPNGFSADPLTDLIRSGARQLIERALDVELSALLAQFPNETTLDEHALLVWNEHLPEREVITGFGPVAMTASRVRDRRDQVEKVRFTSSILPPYLRKAKSVENFLPWLYLKDIATDDFQEALAALSDPMRCPQFPGHLPRSGSAVLLRSQRATTCHSSSPLLQ